MPLKGRVAVALIVRNEQADIASWIAWHAAIGVNKFYIYEDHSDDETYAIIKAASTLFDIELEKTDRAKQPDFDLRRRDAYLSACRKARGVCDWIAFIDGDEYITLTDASTIQEFLSDFGAASAIALSWKIFGSSSRVLQENDIPDATFQAHSRIDFPDNKFVKSIIRPERSSLNYRDPHCMVMLDDAYVNAIGQPVKWEGSTQTPLWEGAIVDHYTCRSMESYTGRIKRRNDADLRNSSTYWMHFDQNNAFTAARRDFLDCARQFLANIQTACVTQAITSYALNHAHIGKMAFPRRQDGKDDRSRPQIVEILKDGKVLQIEEDSRFISVGNPPKTSSFAKVMGLYYKEAATIWLFRSRHGALLTDRFKIRADARSEYTYEFKVECASNGVNLRSAASGLYLCYVPEGQRVPGLVCDRVTSAEWERFTFNPVILETVTPFMSIPREDFTFNSIFEFLAQFGGHASANDLLLALSRVSDREASVAFLKQLAPVGWLL